MLASVGGCPYVPVSRKSGGRLSGSSAGLRDLKVTGLIPWQERRESFLLQNFCVDSHSVSVPPRVTAVARKRPRLCSQKCRWQITAKHVFTFDPTKSEWADYAAVQT